MDSRVQKLLIKFVGAAVECFEGDDGGKLLKNWCRLILRTTVSFSPFKIETDSTIGIFGRGSVWE